MVVAFVIIAPSAPDDISVASLPPFPLYSRRARSSNKMFDFKYGMEDCFTSLILFISSMQLFFVPELSPEAHFAPSAVFAGCRFGCGNTQRRSVAGTCAHYSTLKHGNFLVANLNFCPQATQFFAL
jgi:hypothetical protein